MQPPSSREAPLDQVERLIREIHRRSLWQVLGIYVVASWIVLQVIETLSSLFTLPEWFPGLALALLLIGLPVVLATAFIQEGIGGGSGTSATEATGTDAPAHGLFTWRNALLGGAAAFALWGVVAAGWLLFGGGPPGDSAASGPSAAGESGVPEASLAVLPFETIGSDPDGDMLAAGMHDDLLTRLSQIDGLLVIARTSVQRYRGGETPIREIGRELGVRSVLEGSVQQVGERIRVNAQLIDVGSEGHLWARTFDRRMTDVFALQSELARQIAEELEVRLTPNERARADRGEAVDPEAYRSYVRGRFFWARRTEEDIRRAIDEFEAALELDSAYAGAWAGLADAYVILPYYSNESAEEAFRSAEAAARRALELDPDLAEAHTSLALIRRDHDWDFPGAEDAFLRALELNPGHATAHHWYASTLEMLGRLDEAIAEFERAARLDPLSPTIHQNWGGALAKAGDLEGGLSVGRRARELGSRAAVFMTANILLAMDRREDALAVMEDAELQPGSEARFLARTGREAEAREVAAEMAALAERGEASPARTALAYVSLDGEAALDWLERAAAVRDPWLTWMLMEPAFESLHDHPRWQTLRARVHGGAASTGGA